MPPVLPGNLQRIAVFRALNLGDMLCSIPAVRALRAAYPKAEITLIGLPHMAEFALRYASYFDAFTSFPGVPGLPEQPFNAKAFIRFLQDERAEHYDVIIQMHGKGTVTNPLVAMLGSKRIAGYFKPNEYCPDREYCMPYPDSLPEVRRHLALMSFLGLPLQGEELEFPLGSSDWAACNQLLAEHGIQPAKYVCIHPGARDMQRWWAPEKFAAVADSLADRGIGIVFTGSSGESDRVKQVQNNMRHASCNLTGRTDLGMLAALIAQARLLVSNDTGVSHLAAATATPSVVIFLASDPSRWAPLNADLHKAVPAARANDTDQVLLHAERAMSSAALNVQRVNQ